MLDNKTKNKIINVEDLEIYRKLFDLAVQVHKLSLDFPRFELYELGSQIRRSSNSIPANLAEGFNNKHVSLYLECISRALAELRETKHHLKMAYTHKYITEKQENDYFTRYNECARMLKGLEKSLLRFK